MLPELLHYAIIAFPIVITILIVGKAIKEKRNNLKLCRPRKTTWKAQDFSSALVDSF